MGLLIVMVFCFMKKIKGKLSYKKIIIMVLLNYSMVFIEMYNLWF